MKLTNKALDAFEAQSEYRYQDVMRFPETIQNALIIEFFDSVGIYINIKNLYYQSWWSYVVKKCPQSYNEVVMVSTRTEATNQAIIKANTIYNEYK